VNSHKSYEKCERKIDRGQKAIPRGRTPATATAAIRGSDPSRKAHHTGKRAPGLGPTFMEPDELALAIRDQQRQRKAIKVPKDMLAKAIPTMTDLYEWAKDHKLMLQQINNVQYRTQYELMKAKIQSICPSLHDLLTWSEAFAGPRIKEATWGRYVYDLMKTRRVLAA
jgi:hypothetical protein